MPTEVILIRHGEPRYDEISKRKYVGMGYDLGRLTPLGIEQAEKRARDPLLHGATLILSSPYTRALQTAAILSRVTQIPIMVENDLHEWMPDTTFKFDFDIQKGFLEFVKAKGVRQDVHRYPWETFDHLKERVRKAIEPYLNHEKIIVVFHGIAMSTLTDFDDVIEHCGIRRIFL